MTIIDIVVTSMASIGLMRTLQIVMPHKKRLKGKIFSKWTLLLILSSFYFTIAGSLLEYFWSHAQLNLYISCLGLSLIVFIRIIKWMAVNALGGYWSIHIEIRERQPLIKDKIYGYIRHPSYLTGVLEGIAVPLIANAWWMLLYSFTISIFIYYLRIRFEEKAMKYHYGVEYLKYMKEVNRFMPKFKKNIAREAVHNVGNAY